MKKIPLSLKLWVVFAGVTFCVIVLIMMFLPWVLRSFFTEQVYEILDGSQRTIFSFPASSDQENEQEEKNTTKPRIEYMFILSSSSENESLPGPFLQAVKENALKQDDQVQRYSCQVGERTLFYIIKKETTQGITRFLVSFMWDNYRDSIVEALSWRLISLMIIMFLLSWLPSLKIAHYLTYPLVRMEKHFTKIAEKDWHEPFILKRSDEIGRLAASFENMRQRLVRQDKAQQSFLQYISHELKTPVMTIRTYVQTILDGIYPRGTLEESMHVIEDEAERLEKRIRDLLYLNKITYKNLNEQKVEYFDLGETIERSVERLHWRRQDVRWDCNLVSCRIYGDVEQWGVVAENILDNQMRYAKKNISISLKITEERKTVLLRIWNDGPPIEQALLETMFQEFQTGKGGQFGLGLAIVKRVVDNHRAKIWVRNEEEGVAFYIEI